MVEEHFNESKQQLTNLADKIMLDEGDLQIDNRRFAPIYQKIENFTLSDYLIDLAHDRIENLEVFINDESVVNDYRERIIHFLRDLVRERL
jgi:hypothetical protein